MSPAQESAFSLAAGGPSSSALLLGIASVVAVLALTWFAWLVLRLFRRWTVRRLDLAEMAWYAIRGAVVLSVLGWFIR